MTTEFYIDPEEKLRKYNEVNGQQFMNFTSNETPEVAPINYLQPLEEPISYKPIKDIAKVDTVSDDFKINPDQEVLDESEVKFKNYKLRNYSDLNFDKINKDIIKKESGGNYTAINKNSSAVGLHQFLWKTWGNDIKKVTGVKDKEDFRRNPEAQENYFKYYYEKHLAPQTKKLRTEIKNQDLTDSDLAKLIHFRGYAGAKSMINNNELNVKKEKYNITAADYLKA